LQTSTTSPNELRTERGVAQYHRLASLLRHQIASGERPLGSQLPPLSKLAEEMGIAAVTVRHAYELLSDEGIILSQRGRGTHVIKVPSKVDEDLIVAANNSVLDKDDRLVFKVLTVTSGCSLPDDAHGMRSEKGAFTCVRKVQVLQGTPFSYTVIYVPTEDFRKLPKNAAKKQKILSFSLGLHDSQKCVIQQRTTIDMADQALSALLECPFAAPVAKMVRNLVGPDGKILYAGTAWYRSDRFVSDIQYPANLLRKVPAITEARVAE